MTIPLEDRNTVMVPLADAMKKTADAYDLACARLDVEVALFKKQSADRAQRLPQLIEAAETIVATEAEKVRASDAFFAGLRSIQG